MFMEGGSSKYSTVYNFIVSGCDAGSKVDYISINANTPSGDGRNMTINGVSPTMDSSGDLTWVLPGGGSSCGDTISIKPAYDGSPNAAGSFFNFTAYMSMCIAKIKDFNGSEGIIDPVSGGSIKFTASVGNTKWKLAVAGRTFSGTGGVNITWNGKNSDGTMLSPGSYSATLTATSPDGKCTDKKTINFKVTPAPDGQCGLYVQFGSQAHMASGNLSHSQELFASRGGSLPAAMVLYYNSLDSHNSSLGRGWSHSYDFTLTENSDGSVLISKPNWSHDYFTPSNGSYSASPGNYSRLAKNADGTFNLTSKDGQVNIYANGRIATMTDRNGNTNTFTYSGGQLATVTDPSGRTTSLAYDGANHLATATDPGGNIYTLAVGTTLSSITQPDGGTWQYSYDANAYVLTKIDPRGNTTTYAYDDQHRVVSSADSEGRTRSIAFPEGTDTVKSTIFTEKDAGAWQYRYDTKKGTLVSKTDPQGGTTSYIYDTSGNSTSTINPDGTATNATYDNMGNILTRTNALGQTTSYVYNAFGQVTGITDALSGTTTYAYDAKGNMDTMTDPTGAITKSEYDTKGNVTKVTNSLGQASSFTFDSNGNLVTVTDPSGATKTFNYDAIGNVIAIIDPKGAVTKYIYDNRNHVVKIIDPNGNATTRSYDLGGNKLSNTDANGNTTKYEYNSQSQLIKTIDALGNVTVYAYGGSACPSCGGSNDKLTSIRDANNNFTSYTYNQLGKLIGETDPLDNSISYTYDINGNLIAKTDANGNTITYSYDTNGRLLKKTYPVLEKATPTTPRATSSPPVITISATPSPMTPLVGC